MRNLGQLRGSVTALVTPFRDGSLDLAGLARLCERQIAGGTAALVICGTTGEAPALSATEQVQAIRVAVSAAGDRVPVIAGCSAASTEVTVCLAVAAARYGASALLCAPPAYVKPTQDGIIAHMRAISDAADLPIMLYDVPGRVGVSIADTTAARLFDAGIIFALKDATADLSRPPRLRSLCGEALLQMSGDDATGAAYRAMGGSGCVSVTANVTPALCAALHRAWDDGDLIGFGELRDLLHPLHAALFMESNPMPVKAALEALSLCSGEVRLPLTPASAVTRERLARLLPAIIRAEEAAAPKPRLAIAV
jgi:4-hydroxy-tetrahydrodipicolinate synthase